MVEKDKENKSYPSWENTTVVTIRIPNEVAETLDTEAKKQNKKRNKLASEIIEEAVKEDQ